MNTEWLPKHGEPSDPVLRITDADRVLHRRAIERLRAQLFRRHRPQEFFIIEGSEEVLDPIAYYDARASRMPAPRALHLGGLRYRIASSRPGLEYEAQISP